MTPADLEAVIRQAIREGVAFQWWMYLLVFLFTAFGSYIGAYVKKRGENFATKSDFEALLDQTRRTAAATELIKADITKTQKDEEIVEAYRINQQPVLEEVTRIIVRIREIFRNEFRADYARPWDPKTLSRRNLEASKRDTAVYRVFRFLGAMQIYRSRTAGLPPHTIDRQFDFYYSHKIVGVFAGGHLPDPEVMWRDSILEASELFVEYSEKWKMFKTISWFEFVNLANRGDDTADFLNLNAERVAEFLRTPSIRLALFAIYLIDMRQDTLECDTWEPFRDELLEYIQAQNATWFSIYGKTTNGENDTLIMDVKKARKPRNYYSPFYDRANNPMDYQLEGSSGQPQKARRS